MRTRHPTIVGMPRIGLTALVRSLVVAAATLAAATLAVAFLESFVGFSDASALFIVVVVNAFVSGTLGAVIAATRAFLLYDSGSQLFEM